MDRQTEALLNALKLAYIKLVQSNGFDLIEGRVVHFAGQHIPDRMAEAQILDAIHSIDPDFAYPEPEEEEIVVLVLV